MSKAKILLFDIEATQLTADWGICLCIGSKWLGEPKVEIQSITSYEGWKQPYHLDDKQLLRDFARKFEQADAQVTHYGKRFDLPFINARMLHHGLKPLAPVSAIDTYFIAKHHVQIKSRRLGSLAAFLGCKAEKTPLDPETWRRAAMGDPKAIKYIERHCKADVLVLEEVYNKLRPYYKGHPHLPKAPHDNGCGPCKYCGSPKVQRRGRYISAAKTPQIRVQCRGCGGWAIEPAPKT